MTSRACLAGIMIGDGLDVVVIGALNVSPESFYPGSVASGPEDLLRRAEAMVEAGAAILDVGAMSTAPYRETAISVAEETDRLAGAIRLLAEKLSVALSVDTTRAAPARAALEVGARVVNDVSGLRGDPELSRIVAESEAGLIVMAAEPPRAMPAPPEVALRSLLAESLAIAGEAGVDPGHIVVDPGIGFFRNQRLAWNEWDCRVLARLSELRPLGRPVCVAVSRKSFIGRVANAPDPAERLPGSLAAAAIAVMGGAHAIRTHDVAETVQAVRVAQAVRRAQDEG